MSRQSRQSPKPPSASPSKSSLRSTSGTGGKPQPQPPVKGWGLLPSPTFASPAPVRTASPKQVGFDESTFQAQDEEEEVAGAGAAEQPTFQPFFALVHDSGTSEHSHPSVHYVFEDDEGGAEMISEGVLRSLQHLNAGHVSNGHAKEAEHATRDHVLVLDVDVKNNGAVEGFSYEVTQARSLSADWQVSHVEVTNAPTMSEEDADGGLMLKIEGRGPAVDDGRGHEMGRESLEDMLGRYQRGLEEIRRMVGPGEEGDG